MKFNNSKRYRDFIHKRNEALEKLLNNSRTRLNNITDDLLIKIIEKIKIHYPNMLLSGGLDIVRNKQFENDIDHLIRSKTMVFYEEQMSLRKKSYMLGYIGQVEATTRVTGKTPKMKLDQGSINQIVGEKNPDGSNSLAKIFFVLNKLKRNVINKVELCAVKGESIESAVFQAYKTFPRKKKTPKKPPLKRLVPMKESIGMKKRPSMNGDTASMISLDSASENMSWVFDDQTWGEVVNDYLTDVGPIDRSPESMFDIKDAEGIPVGRVELTNDEVIYGWEIERDITNDFVSSVRAADKAGASINGISDFVVIAIIDDRTCEHCCGDVGCVDFDGLTTAEVEKLTKGEQSAPPYHFNCRCSLAPYDKSIEKAAAAEELPNDLKGFDKWIMGN